MLESEYRDLGDGQGSDNDDHGSARSAPQAAHPPEAQALEPARPAGSAAASATLAQIHRQLIDQTLAECQGNVSQAARRLGVSRGLLYRRLREGNGT